MLLVLENEVDRDKRYFVPEITRYLPEHRVHDVAYGHVPSLREIVDSSTAAVGGDGTDGADGIVDVDAQDTESIDGVILSGSTAGVYESADYPWMDDLRELVRGLVEHEIPTLGVCFGHQLVNDALGGTVEHRGLTADLVDADLADDPLFDGVSPTLPMVHGDHVTRLGDGMVAIATADYYPYLASRHRDAPLWTVQYHPEFTDRLLPRIAADFDWHGSDDFSAVTVERTFENFVRLAGSDV